MRDAFLWKLELDMLYMWKLEVELEGVDTDAPTVPVVVALVKQHLSLSSGCWLYGPGNVATRSGVDRLALLARRSGETV